jgi:PAS domain-containing protein
LVVDPLSGRRHLVGVALDVTEQKTLAEISATADQRVREAIDAISEAFVLWDSSNRLVLCNSKFQRLYNLPADAVRPGAPYAELAAKGAPPMIRNEIALRSNGSGEGRPGAYEARLTDGRIPSAACSPASPNCAARAKPWRRKRNNSLISPNAISNKRRKPRPPIGPRPNSSPI